MKKYFLIPLLGAFLLVGCKDKTDAPQTDKSVVTEETIHSEELDNADHLLETAELVQLNDGEKWVVNAEMKPHIQEGEELIQNYMDEESSDYQDLAEKITEANNKLIKSCTMKGESHDQLHNWLHPHLELTKALKDEENGEEAQNLVHQLKDSYEAFHKYFN